MPIFSIRCEACNNEWEVKMSSGKDIPPSCGECGSGKTSRVWLSGKTPGIPAQQWSPYTLLDRCIPEEPKHFSRVTNKRERK